MSSNTLREWYSRTSIGGLSQARDSGSKCIKISWIIIFILGMTITIYQVAKVFINFSQYPITTAMTVEHKTSVSFPAITLCNTNRINCERLVRAYKSRSNNQSCLNENSDPCELYKLKDILDYTQCEQTEDELYELSDNFNFTDTTDGMDRAAYNEGIFLYFYAELSYETRLEIGHQYEGFIKECSFKSYNCNKPSYFLVTNLINYGNCFTFNSALNRADLKGGRRNISITGSHYGLQIVLQIDQENFMGNGLTQSSGIRVAISDPTIDILPDEFGRDIEPKTKVGIGISQEAISRLEHPYPNNCTNDWNFTAYTESKAGYSIQKCQRFCIQEEIQKHCNCFHPLYFHDIVKSSTANGNTSYNEPCYMVQNQAKGDEFLSQFKCVRNVFNSFDNGTLTCPRCNAACTEINYKASISSNTWPSENFLPFAFRKYVDKALLTNSSADELQELYNNYAKVEIFFESLNIYKTVESAKYTFDSFLSDLGGAFSLMLGISLVMLFEFIELMISLCGLCSGRKKMNKPIEPMR